MIEVKELVKKYGGHVAVDHLSFHVEKGQIYGFLGPNGAGKSTTMNMMTGYLASTEGQIIINGHDVFEEPEEAKRCIGYLPEMPPLYQDMTPMEYLHFVAELKGVAKDVREDMLLDIMEMTKIWDVRDRLIKNLSKGYKQRVGLAQALVGYPEVLILDEPTVGLDPKQIIEIRDLIKSLSEQHTIILSSHILTEVNSICDHVLIISHGKLVASDTPENLSRLMADSDILELTVKGSKEVCEEALKRLEGLEGLEIRMSTVSLEDVFLELTSEKQAEEAEEDAVEEMEKANESEEINEAANEFEKVNKAVKAESEAENEAENKEDETDESDL